MKSLANCKQYQVTLTTSYETEHGISGHTFEMAEYFLYLKNHNINACILLSNGLSKQEFIVAVTEKYTLSQAELDLFNTIVIEHRHPKVLLANTVIIVDGSMDIRTAEILSPKIILLRCSTNRTYEIERPGIIVLQDNDMYEPLSNSFHYKKKILFDYFKPQPRRESLKKTAMFYLTDICRAISAVNLKKITRKYKFDEYIALVNTIHRFDEVTELKVPVVNLWQLFDTYIYTEPKNLSDCSPRFVVECEYYGKEVIYATKKLPLGLQVRLADMKAGIVGLKENDDILKFI